MISHKWKVHTNKIGLNQKIPVSYSPPPVTDYIRQNKKSHTHQGLQDGAVHGADIRPSVSSLSLSCPH